MTHRILHVDDEADIREIVQMALELDPELQVVPAASGREALALAMDTQFDLVLLDLMMPQMDGPATLLALRETGLERMPVVFMTARAEPEQTGRLMALGAAGVLAKPFDPMVLAADLRAFLP